MQNYSLGLVIVWPMKLTFQNGMKVQSSKLREMKIWD